MAKIESLAGDLSPSSRSAGIEVKSLSVLTGNLRKPFLCRSRRNVKQERKSGNVAGHLNNRSSMGHCNPIRAAGLKAA